MALNVSTAILNLILWATGSQCKRFRRDDVGEENFLDLHTTRARVF